MFEAPKLPNVRRIFVPDPGYIMLDCDLSGADAQVVAWEADDEDLKTAFRSGMRLHEKNARDIFGADHYDNLAGDRKQKLTPKGKLYDQCKRGVHLTNYVGTARTMHLNPDIGWPLQTARDFQGKWFFLHPGIREWHLRTEHRLNTDRTVANKFGYRRIYFDRIDQILPEAVAWGPQSTVAEVCFRGALNVEEKLPWLAESRPIEQVIQRVSRFTHLGGCLIQVHDSLVLQMKRDQARAERFYELSKALEVVVPYPDPLIIPWKIAVSDKSWGDCEEIKIELAQAIKEPSYV